MVLLLWIMKKKDYSAVIWFKRANLSIEGTIIANIKKEGMCLTSTNTNRSKNEESEK